MLASEAKALNLEVQDTMRPESESLQERFERQLRLNSAAASALLPVDRTEQTERPDSGSHDEQRQDVNDEVGPGSFQLEEVEEDSAAIEKEIEMLESKTQAALRGRAEWRTVELQDDSIYIRRKLPSPPQVDRTLSSLIKPEFDLDSFVKELVWQPAPPPPLKVSQTPSNAGKLKTPRNARLTPVNKTY